jgi:hypothetical protein
VLREWHAPDGVRVGGFSERIHGPLLLCCGRNIVLALSFLLRVGLGTVEAEVGRGCGRRNWLGVAVALAVRWIDRLCWFG